MELYIANAALEAQEDALRQKLDTEDIDIVYLSEEEHSLDLNIPQVRYVCWPEDSREQAAVLDALLCENGYERLHKSLLYKIKNPCDKNILIYCPCTVARNLFFHLWDLNDGYEPRRVSAFPAGSLSRYAFQNYQDGYTAARCLYLNDSVHLYQAGLAAKISEGENMEFYLIRHADPDYENDALTEYGKKQAEALGKRLAAEGIDFIYSSPLGRAQATAAPLARMLKKETVLLPWAAEVGLPAAYSPSSQLLNEDCLTKGYRWFENERFKNLPISEISSAAFGGLDCLLAIHGYRSVGNTYVADRPNPHRIALFCHGYIGGTLLSHLFGLPINRTWAGTCLWTTGVTKFHFEETGNGYVPSCEYLNDRSHLFDLPDPNFDKLPKW